MQAVTTAALSWRLLQPQHYQGCHCNSDAITKAAMTIAISCRLLQLWHYQGRLLWAISDIPRARNTGHALTSQVCDAANTILSCSGGSMIPLVAEMCIQIILVKCLFKGVDVSFLLLWWCLHWLKNRTEEGLWGMSEKK